MEDYLDTNEGQFWANVVEPYESELLEMELEARELNQE